MAVAAATDVLTAGYGLFVLVFVLLVGARVPNPLLHAFLALGVAALAAAAGRVRGRGRVGYAVSVWYPLALYAFLYAQTGLLNRSVVPEFLDPIFRRLDVAMFGRLPTLALHDLLRGPLWGEVLHAAYFSYYVLIPSVGWLLFRQDRRVFERFVFQLSSLFYLCYAIYLFLPVEGPTELRSSLFDGRGLFERVVNFLYAKGENPGAAFPSSHVAVALLVARWGGARFPTLRWLLLADFALLCLATVYCSFHYGVDVIAGVLLGWGAGVALDRVPPISSRIGVRGPGRRTGDECAEPSAPAK